MTATDTSSTTKDVISSIRREHMYAKFPRTGATKEMILEMARDNVVQFVDMQFTDIFGVLKAVTIPVHKLADALSHNVWFDGSSIDGFTRITESDMYLKPDLNTFSVLPWTKNGEDVTARLICDVYLPDGKPFSGDPRAILKRQLEEARALGFEFNTGPELEFFLFKKGENGELMPLPHDDAGYFDQTTDLGLQIRRHMAFGLDEMGIEVATDPDMIKKDVEQKYRALREALPDLRRLHGKTSHPRVLYYEGLEGVKRVYNDTLTSKTEILNYADSKSIRTFWPEYDEEYVGQRVKKKIYLRGIAPRDEYGEAVVAHNKESFREIRLVEPTEFSFANEINIYNNKVAIISYGKDELVGMIIDSPEIADTQRAIFMMAWEFAGSKIAKVFKSR